MASAQDWFINNDPDNGRVHWKMISTGGAGDIFLMSGVDPNEVIRKYHSIIGTPVMPPQYALGWH